MKKYIHQAVAACFFAALAVCPPATAQEENATSGIQSYPTTLPASADTSTAAGPVTSQSATAINPERPHPSTPSLPALPPLGAIRALPGQSAHAGSLAAPTISPGVPVDAPGAAASAGDGVFAPAARNHAIYKQMAPSGALSYSDHPIAGSSVIKKSDAFRVMRDSEAMSRSGVRMSAANRLEVAAPTKLGQASQTVQIVEGKNGKKYLVSIKAQPVAPCKHSRRKCERELQAAMHEEVAAADRAHKDERKVASRAHGRHKSSRAVAAAPAAAIKHHDAKRLAHHESSQSSRHARAETPEPRQKAHGALRRKKRA